MKPLNQIFQLKNVKSEIFLIVCLIIIAAFLRLLDIEDIPPGLQGDEAWLGLEAKRIQRDGWIGIWTSAGWGQPTGIFYWVATFFKFFPANVTTLRVAIALLGIATIPLFYFFTRSFFGVQPALIGTFLLTFSYWHIHYSRTAYTLISVPLIVCAILLLLIKGLKEKSSIYFLFGGIMSGLGIYTYRGYLSFLLPLTLLWIGIFLIKPASLRKVSFWFISFALPLIFLSIPMGKFIMENPNDYFGYMKLVSIFHNYGQTDQNIKHFLLANITRAVSIYFTKRNPDFTDSLGTEPLLDPVTMIFFLVGLIIIIWRIQDWRGLLILGGIAAGVIVTAITDPTGENRRGIVSLPMIFATAGVGGNFLIYILKTFLHRFSNQYKASWIKNIWYFLLVCIFGSVIVWNINIYFRNIGISEVARFAYCYQLKKASEYLQSFRDEKPFVYFYSPRWSWNYEARRFLISDISGEDRSNEFGKFSLEKNPLHQKVVYLLMPPYDQYLADIQALYPGGKTTEAKKNEKLLFKIYYLEK